MLQVREVYSRVLKSYICETEDYKESMELLRWVWEQAVVVRPLKLYKHKSQSRTLQKTEFGTCRVSILYYFCKHIYFYE